MVRPCRNDVVTDLETLADGKTQPVAEPFEVGPVFDVVPYVHADGYTIQMTMTPTIRQFLGYDLEAAKKFEGGNLATTNPIADFSVFVTPTIIDPAGNRVHAAEQMPFRESSVPSQQPFK